jgi:hypothetical protein
LTNNGSVVFTPASDYHSQASFEYTISDSNVGTDSTSVSVTINPINDPPVANNDAATTEAGTPVKIDVIANHTDADNDFPLSLVNVSTPSYGSAQISGNRVIYTPSANFNGQDSFT